jgi:hypothetical protein
MLLNCVQKVICLFQDTQPIIPKILAIIRSWQLGLATDQVQNKYDRTLCDIKIDLISRWSNDEHMGVKS